MTWKRQKVDDKDALPVAAHRQAVLDALDEHGVLVISGDTGCGKSTQVPQFLLDQDAAHRIVVTQPRRLAARALAERSAERGRWWVDEGYAVSRDRVTSLNATRHLHDGGVAPAARLPHEGVLRHLLPRDRRRGARKRRPRPPPCSAAR